MDDVAYECPELAASPGYEESQKCDEERAFA
jgi:hypothetical protein